MWARCRGCTETDSFTVILFSSMFAEKTLLRDCRGRRAADLRQEEQAVVKIRARAERFALCVCLCVSPRQKGPVRPRTWDCWISTGCCPGDTCRFLSGHMTRRRTWSAALPVYILTLLTCVSTCHWNLFAVSPSGDLCSVAERRRRRDLAETWHELSRTLLLFLDSFVHRVTKTGANFSVVAVVTGLLCVFNSIKCGSASVFALCVSEVPLNHSRTGNTVQTG